MYLTILQSFNLIGEEQNFLLKSFDTTVTLKSFQSHWKCNEQVKLKM